ncbi:hypothetical protein [Paucibacter soli]|uniref:hypothetical protein n=1 Tax=Paucibacter soli TaxID=3133433 RepID=UPI0030950422
MSTSEELRRRHLTALKSVLEFSNASDISWSRGAAQACASEITQVRSYIANGVPCGPGATDLLEFFLAARWEGRVDFEGLWQDYVKAGFVKPATVLFIRYKNGFVHALPLEAALLAGNLKMFDGLLQSGAKVLDVPSRPWRPSKKTGKCSIKGIEGFIKFCIKDPTKRMPFEASALAASMAEVIERRLAGKEPIEPVKPAKPVKAPKAAKPPKVAKPGKKVKQAGKEEGAAEQQADLFYATPEPSAEAEMPRPFLDPMTGIRPGPTAPTVAAHAAPAVPAYPLGIETRSAPIVNPRMRRGGL